MPRGPLQRDAKLFGPAELPGLRDAAYELSWLLSRGYNSTSALELVGNRHQLRKRQRQALQRSTCRLDHIADRRSRRVALQDLAGRAIGIDGFNVIITVESGLAGGVILRGPAGAHRDLSSVHGSYRRAQTTERALERIADVLAAAEPAQTVWYLDRPVSNSGRVKVALAELAERRGLRWRIELVASADRMLKRFDGVVATSDAGILDRGVAWTDLTGAALEGQAVWLVDFGGAKNPIAP